MILNLIGNKDNCQKDCSSFIQGWGNWINSSRPFGAVRYEGNYICHSSKPAIITIPENHAEYLKLIGCKGRNMISKSLRNGYTAEIINFNDYIDDIYSVNTSKPERQGRKMTEGYTVKPKASSVGTFCELHFIKYYGILKEGKLYAWCNISFMNELVIVNQILGHGDHLKFGIMNSMISFVVKDCIENHPQTKYINYLTLSGCMKGLQEFKKSVGFQQTDCKFLKNI